MDKLIRIVEFAQQLFGDSKIAEQASQIIEGIMEARSPRLSEVAAKMPGNPDASYKRLQRFLQENDPQATLNMLFNEEADFVVADSTEIERPHADQTEYGGILVDGQTKGFWMLTLATPLRGRAIRDVQYAQVNPNELNLLSIPEVDRCSGWFLFSGSFLLLKRRLRLDRPVLKHIVTAALLLFAHLIYAHVRTLVPT